MKVNVRIFGEIAATFGRKHTIELQEDSSVSTLISTIQKKAGMAPKRYLGEFKVGGADLAIMVNGKNIALLDGVNTVLSDEDDVVIMPFVAGG